MRDPSIHISKSQFKHILSDLGIKRFPVDRLFIKAKEVSLNSRIIYVTSNKDKKKISNITLASTGDANLAADILYSVQIHLKHRGVKRIKEGTSQWSNCKRLAEVCNTFCEDFNLEPREGYILYIKKGFERLGSNTRNYINRLISMSQIIAESIQASQYISQDSDPELTEEIYEYYQKVIADRTGIKLDFKDPDKYIYFVKLREFCEVQGIDPIEWVDAQFEGLLWCNGIPDPDKLIGDKAQSYYAKFKYKNPSINTQNTEPKVTGSLWDQIKEEDE